VLGHAATRADAPEERHLTAQEVVGAVAQLRAPEAPLWASHMGRGVMSTTLAVLAHSLGEDMSGKGGASSKCIRGRRSQWTQK